MGSLTRLLGLLFILQFGNVQGGSVNCFINGVEYQCGRQHYIQNCMRFDCHCDGRWVTNASYNPLCSGCYVRNDPHFTTFDGARYDWHGDCTYVLAEEEGGVSYVYNKFTKCGIASCVDDVTFKPRVGPIIKIQNSKTVLSYGSPYDAEIVINGHTQKITDKGREMQVLKGPDDKEYPVLAYYLSGCLHLIAVDKQDFLVKICKRSVRVFSATKKNSDKNISGMCGSPDDGPANEDLRLRDGTIVENPGGCCFDHIVDEIFAHNWQVQSAPCLDTSGRRRSTGKKLCEASDAQKAEYYRVCADLIGKEKSLSKEMKKEFIDNCAFDQCIVTQTGADPDTIKDWLNQYTDLIEQVVFEQEHQDDISEEDYEYIDYLNDYYDELETDNPDQSGNEKTTTPAPELTCNISSVIEVGNKQYAFFNCRNTYTKARDFCKLYGWELATPNDHFAEFNDRMPRGEYWLDVKSDTTTIKNGPMVWFWQTSPKHQTTEAQWNERYYNTQTANSGTNCASLWQNDGLIPHDCEDDTFYACESFHFLNVQRNEMPDNLQLHGQKMESPLRNF